MKKLPVNSIIVALLNFIIHFMMKKAISQRKIWKNKLFDKFIEKKSNFASLIRHYML